MWEKSTERMHITLITTCIPMGKGTGLEWWVRDHLNDSVTLEYFFSESAFVYSCVSMISN